MFAGTPCRCGVPNPLQPPTPAGRDPRLQALFDVIENYNYETGLDEKLCQQISFCAAEAIPGIESLESSLTAALEAKEKAEKANAGLRDSISALVPYKDI